MNPGRCLVLWIRQITVGLAWIALIVHAATADAAGPPLPARPPAAASRAPHRTLLFVRPAAGGLVIGIDRETGMLVMPEPEQLARLLVARETGARAARPAPVRHPDGSYTLDVRGWMRDYLIVGVSADGRPRTRCMSGRGAATRALHEPTPAAMPEEQ